MSDALDTHLLAIYLNDHVAGATVGVQRVRRMARVYDGTVVGAMITPLVPQLEEEREWLLRCLELMEIPLRRYKVVGAAVAERVGRLKFNGHVRAASPLSALLEVELLRGAITGKSSGWQTLKAQSARLGLPAERVRELDELVVQADDQICVLSGLLEVLHAHVFERGRSTTP
ncbi:hypothetical protein [Oerskovia enterophila]|uniref:hypothetical protein n=1 Tax=Oerskovia enterophila TaxID=43678 RepID=UPI0033981181